ncbi:MAG TPA: penicillin-binding transpeptidase domain-containing protein, partial [Alphaproteobacteria bacterium]|nr:penicillin-binding transpeptidase domain-containing protein [Alphaproteobacteria bacterium]
AYAVIARNGMSVKPYAILKVADQEGQVLYNHKMIAPQRLVAAPVAQKLTQMMQAVMTYGSGKKAALGRPSAGKTGTTQLYRDAWLIGFTPELVTGVWAGNDDNTSLDPKPGSPAVMLWHLVMSQAPYSSVTFPQEASHDEELPAEGLLDNLIDSLFGG